MGTSLAHHPSTDRLWLQLYSQSVVPGLAQRATPSKPPAFDFFALPAEVLERILSSLAAEQLSVLAMTSRMMRAHVYAPRLWRRLAQSTWPNESVRELERRLFKYKTWRKMVIERPHLRTDGYYILRNQFTKTSTKVLSAEPVAPVFLVTYHRFFRFYRDGTVVALTTPEPLDKAYVRVRKQWNPMPSQLSKASPLLGQYEFDERQKRVSVKLPMVPRQQYPNMRQGTVFFTFELFSSPGGAFNMLRIVDHFGVTDHDNQDVISFGRSSGVFRFVSRFGFKSRVGIYFPKEEHVLAKWSKYASASS